jgi:hypothetical protein
MIFRLRPASHSADDRMFRRVSGAIEVRLLRDAMCRSCHDRGPRRAVDQSVLVKMEGCGCGNGGTCWSPTASISPRGASLRHAAEAELRHSGACWCSCLAGAGPQRRGGMGFDERAPGLRFRPARTGSDRSAARARSKLRPSSRARLQLTSSLPPRSPDSRVLTMIGGGPCYGIKIYVSDGNITAIFLASGLQVFCIVSRTGGMAMWRKGVGFFQ